jgi:hypothetical protein
MFQNKMLRRIIYAYEEEKLHIEEFYTFYSSLDIIRFVNVSNGRDM